MSRSKVEAKYNGLKEDKSTLLSTIAMEQNVNAIRRIRAWKQRQIIHMPALVDSETWEPMPEKDEDGAALNCWNIQLQFPSSFNSNSRSDYCSAKLVEKETRLRTAAAYDSLSQIRLLLQRKWWLIDTKKKDVLGTGQKRNTKSNAAIRSLEDRCKMHVERYRRNRAALISLDSKGPWLQSLKRLKDSDVRMLADDEGMGEGRRKPSWIWSTRGAASPSEREIYYGTLAESCMLILH